MTTEFATGIAAVPARGDRLPSFTGKTPTGEEIRLRDFYMRRNLALVFTHGLECGACRHLLRHLAEKRAAVQAESGEIVAVIAGESGDMPSLPYPVVVDQDGQIHRHYGLFDASDRPLVAVFLADRYGVIFETALADEGHALPSPDEVVSWLEFIACRCS
jgi:peroxiredoxin